MQRRQLERDAQPLAGGLHMADSVVAGMRSTTAYLKAHPEVVTAAVALLVLLKPGRVWRWSKRGFLAWRTWSMLRQKLSALGLRPARQSEG